MNPVDYSSSKDLSIQAVCSCTVNRWVLIELQI